MTRTCIAGFLVAMAAGCTPPPPATPEQALHTAFESAYAPLRACVAEKSAGLDRAALAAKLVAGGGMATLRERATRLLGGNDRYVRAAAPGVAPEVRQAEGLLQGLQESAEAAQGDDATQKNYRLGREAAAGFAVAPALGCTTTPELLRLAREAGDADVLVSLATEYGSYQTCLTSSLGAGPDITGRLPQLVIDQGQAQHLQSLAQHYLGQTVVIDTLPVEAQLRATGQTLVDLTTYGTRWATADAEPYANQVRRLTALVEVMQLTAAATSSKCSPSDSLTRWMDYAKNEYH